MYMVRCVRLALLALALALLASSPADAYWRLSCGLIQTGRIDPVVSPGAVAGHVHKIAGASNINISSTYATLQAAPCTSCTVQADKSAYWTPSLYYQHPNGTFEPVGNSGMAVYYLGRGDNRTNIQPFPPGFRMLSGDSGARSYDAATLTYKNTRPVADRVSFACLDVAPMPETPGMVRTACKNGLRAQVQFQSCWNGADLYLPGNAHVAYLSAIDNGVCPPTHPVPLIHLFYEVLYAMDSVNVSDGGRFVFSQGDTTGFGFHGDFINGWDVPTLASAIKNCVNTDNGNVADCPALAASNDNNVGTDCPPRPSIVLEKVSGLLPSLPGCNAVTSGPGRASAADMTCPPGTPVPVLATLDSYTHAADGWSYLGCASEAPGRALSKASVANSSMTATLCRAFCAQKGYSLAGVEYSRECYCANSFTAGSVLNQTGCTMLCAGDPAQICGGPNRVSVWQAPAAAGRKLLL